MLMLRQVMVTNKDECVTTKVSKSQYLTTADVLIRTATDQLPQLPDREHLLQLQWRMRHRIPGFRRQRHQHPLPQRLHLGLEPDDDDQKQRWLRRCTQRCV